MMQFLKIISTIIVFLVVSFFIKTVFSIITGLEGWISSFLSLCFAMLVCWYVWKWFSGKSIGLPAAILSGQDTQQAATIGILFASPLGMILGAIAGYRLVSRQKD